MKHVNALSRNPCSDKPSEVLQIEQADWVLSGQLADKNIQDIHQTLSTPPETDGDRQVCKNYALRDGKVYRITARGIQWVVPRGMRNQIVRAAHDDLGHFGVEKTLYRLSDDYWFPRMRKYVEQYIAHPILIQQKVVRKKGRFLKSHTKEARTLQHVPYRPPRSIPQDKNGQHASSCGNRCLY